MNQPESKEILIFDPNGHEDNPITPKIRAAAIETALALGMEFEERTLLPEEMFDGIFD